MTTTARNALAQYLTAVQGIRTASKRVLTVIPGQIWERTYMGSSLVILVLGEKNWSGLYPCMTLLYSEVLSGVVDSTQRYTFITIGASEIPKVIWTRISK